MFWAKVQSGNGANVQMSSKTSEKVTRCQKPKDENALPQLSRFSMKVARFTRTLLSYVTYLETE